MEEYEGALDGHVCVVVGGAGFLGTKIVEFLSVAGATVRVYDLATPKHIPRDVKVYLGDVRNESTLKEAMQGADCVIHCASYIDVTDFPPPELESINIEGTKTVLAAASACKVSYFIYTSSIDVVFTGKPIENGDESLPVLTDRSLCQYGYTKAVAERLVLDANRPGFVTAALRPSHIFGPGDKMISLIVDLAAQDDLRFAFGEGDNDYIYVDNAAAAHVQCLIGMIKSPTGIAGQAFFISDYHINIWSHCRVFLRVHRLETPTIFLPLWLVYFFAILLRRIATVVRKLTNSKWAPTYNAYSVLAVGQPFYFNCDKAKRAFNFQPIVSFNASREATAFWVATFSLDKVPQLYLLHIIHVLFGLLLFGAGSWQFLFPDQAARLVGLDHSPFPSPSAVLSQTTGLILAVVGIYSFIAGYQKWSMAFFQAIFWPHMIVGLALLYHVYVAHIPESFTVLAGVHLLIGLLTIMAFSEKQTFQTRFDRVTVAQLLHSCALGLLTTAMMIRPSLVLPLVLPKEIGITRNQSALAWSYTMGTLELVMLWTYTASAVLFELQQFARLSVQTRLGALTVLTVSYLAGTSTITQLAGVLPDGLLALLTAWALQTYPRPSTRAQRHKMD